MRRGAARMACVAAACLLTAPLAAAHPAAPTSHEAVLAVPSCVSPPSHGTTPQTTATAPHRTRRGLPDTGAGHSETMLVAALATLGAGIALRAGAGHRRGRRVTR